MKLSQGNGKLILVVDDEEEIRDLTRMILEADGYKVLLAADGNEATSVFAEHSSEIDLVLTDMVMPEVDGISAVDAIRKIRPDVKTIAVTGHVDNVQYVDLLGDVDAVLRKPYKKEILLSTIAQVLTGSPETKNAP